MPDISQDTIAAAGLAPKVSDMIGGDVMGTYGQKSAALKTRTDALGKVEQLSANKATAEAPKMDEMAKAAAEPSPAAPPQERAPDYQKPQLNPKEVQDSFGQLMAMSMLVGLGSRTPFYAAMQAMTGALTGFQNRDDKLVEQSIKSYNAQLAAIKERNDAARVDFDAAWKKYASNLPRLKQELEIIGAKYDLPIATENARIASIDSAVKEFDNTIKSGETALTKLDQLAQKAQHDHEVLVETKARDQAAAQAREEAHQDRMAMIASRNGPTTTATDGKPAPGVEAATWALLINNVHPFRQMSNAVMANVEKIAADNNMSPQQLMSASADVKSRLQAKRTFETRVQNLGRAENQLDLEIPVMEEAMRNLAPIDSPLASHVELGAIRNGVGTKEQRALVTQLDQAAGAVFDEFNGIVTGNPGTLNVQDVQNAQEQYKKAQSPTEMRAAIAGMRRIIANAKRANDKTRGEIMGGINDTLTGKTGGDPGNDPSAQPRGAAPYSDPDKERRYQEWKRTQGAAPPPSAGGIPITISPYSGVPK